jgi:hypothetical protein
MAKDRDRQGASEAFSFREEDQREPEAPSPREVPFLEENEERRHDKRLRKRERRLALAPISRGLLFHYVATWMLLAGVVSASLGLGLVLVSLLLRLFAGDMETAQNITKALGILALLAFFFSNALILLGSATDFPCSLFCLRVPDATACILIGGVILLRFFTVGAIVWFLVLASSQIGAPEIAIGAPAIAMATVLVLQLLAWWVWMSFLRRACLRVGSRTLAQEAGGLFLTAIMTVLGSAAAVLLFVFFLSLLLMAVLRPMPWGIFTAVSTAGIAALIKLIMAVREESSLIETVLSPTGIPFVLRYVGLLAALRADAA